MKRSKWLIILLAVIGIPLILFYTDKIYARIDNAHTEKKIIRVEVGDIILRTKSYVLSGSKYYCKSGMPGHLAIAISEGEFTNTDNNLGNIEVAESAFFNRYKKTFQAEVSINKAFENFNRIRGKRFLLKMHLSADQKEMLKKRLGEQIGKPYSIFATKKSQQEFHCATLAHWAILSVAGIDLDTDGGIVFPNDILRNPRFDKPGDRIRF